MLVVLPGLVDSLTGDEFNFSFFKSPYHRLPGFEDKARLAEFRCQCHGQAGIDFLMGDVQEGLGGQPGYGSRRV